MSKTYRDATCDGCPALRWARPDGVPFCGETHQPIMESVPKRLADCPRQTPNNDRLADYIETLAELDELEQEARGFPVSGRPNLLKLAAQRLREAASR